jgi:apolipoprotein N-acyltransferase
VSGSAAARRAAILVSRRTAARTPLDEEEGEPLSVALLQGNVAQEMKWRPERFADSLHSYYRLALENPARLTVLPETALPAFLDQIPADYLDALQQLALRQQGDLLLGIPVAEGRHYYNAAVSLGASGRQRYDKVHLVPFGEFVPPGFAWFMAMANIPMSDFTAGSPAGAAGAAAPTKTPAIIGACRPRRG